MSARVLEQIRVLHVDDHPDVTDLTATFLEREDDRYIIEAAASASEGFDRLDDNDYDCIVSDYDMPGQDGIEFLRTVREEYPDIPFILYTGKGSEAIASEAISAGVTDYLQKGTGTSQYEVLSNRITNAVEQARANRRAVSEHRISTVIRQVDQALVRATTKDEIDEVVCEILSNAEPYRFAWIGELDPDTQTIDPRTAAGIGEDYLDRIEIIADESRSGQGPTGNAIQEGELAVMQNIPADPRYEPWREQALSFGFKSSAAIPLNYEDTMYGVLNLYADRTRNFDAQERRLLSTLGETIGHAYHRIDLKRQFADQYRTLFEEAPVLVVFTKTTDDGPMIEECNVAFAERLGYTRNELRETPLGKYYSDASAEKLLDGDGYERALTGEFTREQRTLVTCEGEEILTLLRASPRRNPDGERIGTHALFVDITDERQIEKLERQNERLDLLNQILRHDIRNDLQLVTAYADLLAEECDDQELHDYIETVIESADHAVDLTTTAKQLADVMRSSDEKLKQVNLQASLQSELDDIESSYPHATVTCETAIPNIPVRANEMLDSVFRNILKNAIQHNNKDTPKITVSATERSDSAVIRFADNGPGVPDNQKDEIFGKGEKGLESQGTGLGLYLVQVLVGSNGGGVWVEDNEPEGAEFVVELPKAE